MFLGRIMPRLPQGVNTEVDCVSKKDTDVDRWCVWSYSSVVFFWDMV